MADQDTITTHEQELAEYLQERIKPGLNRGAIPLLARSIAGEIVRREHDGGGSEDPEPDVEHDEEPDDEPTLEAGDADDVEADAGDEQEGELDDEADDEPDDEDDDESESPVDEFEAEMRELQAELGEEWIVRFSVQGDDAWLTAEKQDGSQHVEGPTAEVLLEAVELLDEGGGRSG